jgi:hypothetical protein
MCKFGDEVMLVVPIPASLSHTGKFRWDSKGVDKCIAPIVDALNKAGIYTSSSCCGHGFLNGVISLHDGRLIEIHTTDAPESAAKWLDKNMEIRKEMP